MSSRNLLHLEKIKNCEYQIWAVNISIFVAKDNEQVWKEDRILILNAVRISGGSFPFLKRVSSDHQKRISIWPESDDDLWWQNWLTVNILFFW